MFLTGLAMRCKSEVFAVYVDRTHDLQITIPKFLLQSDALPTELNPPVEKDDPKTNFIRQHSAASAPFTPPFANRAVCMHGNFVQLGLSCRVIAGWVVEKILAKTQSQERTCDSSLSPLLHMHLACGRGWSTVEL